MPNDRVSPRERAESNAGNSDNTANLSASVSDTEMRDFHRNRKEANRNENIDGLGSLGFFDSTDEVNAQADSAQELVIPRINTIVEFQQRAENIFSRIDEDSNGYLSRQEMGRAVENRQLVGPDAQVMAGLFDSQTRARLVNFSNDEWGSESEVSLRDIQGLSNNERDLQIENTDRIVSTTRSSFSRLDSDGNGFIASTEIDSALGNDRISILERGALSRLRSAYDELQLASNDEWLTDNDGISMNDLTAYSGRIDGLRQDRAAANNALWLAQRTHQSSENQISDELYAGVDPEFAISPRAIQQGRIADCYFLAALASVAQSNPGRIESMIRDNRNGTYTVTFPGDPQHPVTVSAPTETELGVSNGGSKFGTWAGVLERAFGQWRLENGNSRFPDAVIALEGAHGPDSTDFAMRVLTGRQSVQREVGQLTNEQLVVELNAALNSGEGSRAVTASVPGESDSDRTPDGFPRHHAYSVLSFEPEGNSGGYVTVRNPWGNGENSTNGTIRVGLAQFRNNFSHYTVLNP